MENVPLHSIDPIFQFFSNVNILPASDVLAKSEMSRMERSGLHWLAKYVVSKMKLKSNTINSTVISSLNLTKIMNFYQRSSWMVQPFFANITKMSLLLYIAINANVICVLNAKWTILITQKEIFRMHPSHLFSKNSANTQIFFIIKLNNVLIWNPKWKISWTSKSPLTKISFLKSSLRLIYFAI